MKKLLMVAGLLFAQASLADYSYLVDLSQKDSGWDVLHFDNGNAYYETYGIFGGYDYRPFNSSYNDMPDYSYENYIDGLRGGGVNMYAGYNGGYGPTFGGAFTAPANVSQSTVDLGPIAIQQPQNAYSVPAWYHPESFAIVDNYDFYNLVPGDTYSSNLVLGDTYISSMGDFVASSSGHGIVTTVSYDTILEAPEIDTNLAGLSIGLLSGILFLSAAPPKSKWLGWMRCQTIHYQPNPCGKGYHSNVDSHKNSKATKVFLFGRKNNW